MKDLLKKYWPLLAAVVFVYTSIVLSRANYNSQVKIYEQTLSAEYREKERALQQELRATQGQRDSLASRLADTDRHIEVLLRIDSIKTKELSKIKGKFDKLGDDELSRAMEEAHRRAVNQ